MANRFLTKETLKEAVDLWCKNRDEAKARYGHIRKWDVSGVTNMRQLFQHKKKFNDNISRWDVSNVTNMSGMFHGARAFNQPIGVWNVSNVTDMNNMFEGAFAFNEAIENWDVSNVTSMRFMFHGAELFNQPIGLWNVSNVTYMTNMFGEAYKFNQPIGAWDVSNVTGMSYMFRNAHKFNQPIGDWNVSNVTDMNCMFENAFNFNQNIRNWNMSNVTKMENMFSDAIAMQPDNKPTAPAPRPPAPSQTVRPQLRYRYSLTDGTLHALPSLPEPVPQPQSHITREMPPATIVYNDVAATPLEESSTVLDPDAKAVDIIGTGEEFKVTEYLDENIRNVAFKIGNAYSISTKDDIENYCINSESRIIFGCKNVDTAIVPRAQNVIKDIPYINPLCVGIAVGLFRLSDIKTVLNDPTIRCIEVGDYPIDEKGERAKNAIPVKELVTVTSLSMLGRNPNALGALHCQDGQKMQVYSLRKMAFPPVPVPDMGVSKQRRMTKRKHSIYGKHSLKEKRSQKSKRSRKGIRTLNGGAKRTRRA